MMGSPSGLRISQIQSWAPFLSAQLYFPVSCLLPGSNLHSCATFVIAIPRVSSDPWRSIGWYNTPGGILEYQPCMALAGGTCIPLASHGSNWGKKNVKVNIRRGHNTFNHNTNLRSVGASFPEGWSEKSFEVVKRHVPLSRSLLESEGGCHPETLLTTMNTESVR